MFISFSLDTLPGDDMNYVLTRRESVQLPASKQGLAGTLCRQEGRAGGLMKTVKLHGLHLDLPNFVKQRPLRRDVKCKQLATIRIFVVLPVMMMY